MEKRRKSKKSGAITRRGFLKGSAAAAGAVLAAPAIVPSSVFGAAAPSNRITFGCIGTGRIARTMDIPEFLSFEEIRIIAVCDLDAKRRKDAQAQVEGHYSKMTGKKYKGCATYSDYRELVRREDLDAVMICTPDHWHALPAIAAARSGKDIFVQKPLSLTIREGRAVSDAAHRHGRVLQVGSQLRSEERFRFACELVRNGRIGKLHTVKVGLPTDPGCGEEPEMPVPENLDYDMWLGSTPHAPYTEKRVHPQKDYSRPGWLRIQAYGAGMITGWGAHNNDIAHWGMDTEHTGPVEIQGEGLFPESGLWDVHGDFNVEYTYANGVKLFCTDNKKNKMGVRFEGDEGWIHVTRGSLDTMPKTLLSEKIGPEEIHLYRSDSHKKNFIDCIKSRSLTIAPAEIGHRSCTVCLLGLIAMKLRRKLHWDPVVERFKNDDEANRMLERPMRLPWRLEM